MIEDKAKFLKTNLRNNHRNPTNHSFMTNSIISHKGDHLFSTFVYQDQVTRSKYEVSQLKNSRRIKTQSDDTPKKSCEKAEQKNLHGELKILQSIKQNRNKKLALSYKTKGQDKDSKVEYESASPDKIELQKMKRKMRKQVSSLNHLFLREYLYHQQPFNRAVAQINRQSDSALMDGNKVFELKNRIIKCIQDRKQSSKIYATQQLGKGTNESRRKSLKKFEEIKNDNDFKRILEQVRKEINKSEDGRIVQSLQKITIKMQMK